MDEFKKWVYKFFSVLNEDELIDVLKEFYNTALNDGARDESDFIDSLQWTLADHEEIDDRM
jgi:hypothetical protein